MSNNGGINIGRIDFTKLPDDFNLGGVEDILHSSTAKKLEAVNIGNDKKITLDDGLDKDETKYIMESINIDDMDEEISNEEINKFLKEVLQIENPTEIQVQDITTLVQNIAIASKDATGTEETDDTNPVDTTEAADAAAEENAQENTGNLQITVQSWGSAAENGNKYANDCLDHIMKNYYQELTPYSEEWYAKETEIMNSNPGIYGDENGTGARASINGGGRRNAVIHDGDAITLPGIASQIEGAGREAADNEGAVEGANPDTQAAAAQIPDNAQEQGEREQIEEGIEVATYVDAEGNVIGKRQFNGEDVMWESTIAADGENTVETRSWTDSGNVEVITYDGEGKELNTTTIQQDGITSEAIYSYDNSGAKTATVTYSQDGNTIGAGTQTFSEDGSYVEHVEYTGGENAGQKIDTTYTKAGITSSMTLEYTCGEDAGSGAEVSYENGLPLQAVYHDANHETIGTVDYKYNEENNTRTELVTNLKDNQIAVIKYDAKGQEIDRCSFTYGEDGKPVGEIEGNANLLIEIGETNESDEDDGGEEDARTVTSENIIDGGRTKRTEYDNGDVEYFYRGTDGQFTDKPSELYAADGSHTITHYNDDGNKTDETIYNSENKLQYTSEYTYNEDGTYALTETEYHEDGKTIKTKTITEADGTVTTEEYDENGNLVKGTPGTEEPEETAEEIKEAELRADIAAARAQALHAAMDRAGTDEETVREIINNVSGQDLVDVIKQYEEMYGTSLEDAIKGDFSWISGESDLLRKLDSAKSEVQAYENMIATNPGLNAPARTEINQEMVYEAQLLAFKAATSNRLGTDELVLFDMFQGMEDAELKAFLEYAKGKDIDIKTTIQNETSFETQKSLIQRVETLEGTQPKPKTDVDAESSTERSDDQIRADIATTKAQALHAAMDRAGTDEETVRDIINNTSGQDLVDIINEYERLFKTTLEDAIKGDFSWISGESDLLRKLDSAKSEVQAYENMIAANPGLNAPARTGVTLEELHKAQLQAFKAATTNRLGTDEKIVYQMLQNGSMTDADIIALNESLKGENTSLIAVLESEFSGETLKALLRRMEQLGIKKDAATQN